MRIPFKIVGRRLASAPALFFFLTCASVHAEASRLTEARAPAPEPSPALTVRGEAEVTAAPDRATVQLGAEAQADTAQAAQDKIAATMHTTLDRLCRLGIPDAAIQTTGSYLEPVYSQPNPQAEKVVGYRSSEVIRIQVNDLTLLGKVIDSAVASGANRIQGISFALKNELPQRLHALKRAVEVARRKAEAIAQSLGVELGPVERVSETGAVVGPPRPMMMAERALTLTTPVQPGQIRVQASVTISYGIGRSAQTCGVEETGQLTRSAPE